MLRHNEDRNLMAFKYSNRSIRIFPIFENTSNSDNEKPQQSKKLEEFKNRSFLSKDSENFSERDSEDQGECADAQSQENFDIQQLDEMSPIKIRSKSEHI